MTLPRSPIAGPHFSEKKMKAMKDKLILQRIGALLWWRFEDAATDPTTLAKLAHAVGYPSIFLPVPFPVSNKVAFHRALRRATSGVPDDIGGRWNHNRIPVNADTSQLLKDSGIAAPTWRVWITASDRIPESTMAKALRGSGVEAKERTSWFVMDDRVSTSSLMQFLEKRELATDLARFLGELGLEPETWRKQLEKAISDLQQVQRFAPGKTPRRPWLGKLLCAVEPSSGILLFVLVSDSPASDGSYQMVDRIRAMYDEERTLSTNPEIGDGVMAALEDARGVKLRPGLWAVPGNDGIARSDVALEYLRGIGSTKAGVMDLYDDADAYREIEGLVQIALLDAIEDFDEKLGQAALEAMQTGALRTAWSELTEMKARIEGNRVVLGAATDQLLERLEPLRQRVRDTAGRKKVALEQTAGETEVHHLLDALEKLRQAAHRGDRAALAAALPLLRGDQPAARAGGFAALLRRLRKLAEEAEHIHNGALFSALEEAVDFVEERVRKAYPAN